MATPRYPRRPVSPRTDSSAEQVSAHDVTSTDGRLLYTPEEAAELLRVRPSWLRKKAAARKIPCTFLGKHLRFSPADLAAIVAPRRRTRSQRTPRAAAGPATPNADLNDRRSRASMH